MSGYREIADPVVTASIDAIRAAEQKVINLDVCAALVEGPLPFERLAMTLVPNPFDLIHGKRATNALIRRAVEADLIMRADVGFTDNGCENIDAGRFHLKNRVTGQKAHSILSEIEAEMAGDQLPLRQLGGGQIPVGP